MKWQVLFVIIVGFLADVLGLAIAIVLQSMLAIAVFLASSVMGFYWIFIRLHKKRKPRYPLVPPEGRTDIYLPRTDIPRPIYEDFRKMKEKRKNLEKLKKLSRKKKQAK